MKKQHDETLEKRVMSKIIKGEITMKPKWYFLLGSFLTGVGLVGASMGAIFATNLLIFLVRKHGPGIMKLQFMVSSFPWWVPILALLCIAAGIWLLKKYDFSYKKNFVLIVAVFLLSIFLAAFIIDAAGLNEEWSRRGPGKRFYHQFEMTNSNVLNGRDRYVEYDKE